MKIGHLFLSIFEFKKRVSKSLKLSIFSISPKYFDKNLSKDPRKVQFLFSNERKLISRFSRIFWYFYDQENDPKKLSKDPQKSKISYFFTIIANSGDLLVFFRLFKIKIQRIYKIILRNRIFCFRYHRISLFGGSIWHFLFHTSSKKTSVLAAFIVRQL